MPIRYRPDRKKWQVEATVNGKRKRILVQTKEEAKEINSRLALMKFGFDGIGLRYSIAEAFASYLKTESAQKTKAVESADRTLLGMALQFFNAQHKLFHVDQITLEHLQLFQLWCQNEHKWSDTTIAVRMKVLRAVLKKLIMTKRIRENPAQYWKVPAGKSIRRRPMSEIEFQKLIQSGPSPWLRAVLLFIRLTGARGASVAALKWSDVDFIKARLLLSSRKGGLKKIRTVWFPMYQELFNFMATHRNAAVTIHRDYPNEFVFLDDDHNKLTGHKISVAAHRLIKKAGVEGVVLYSLRHALAVDLTEAGVSLEITRQLMGHSNIRQTQEYAQGIGIDSLKQSVRLIRGDNIEERTAPEVDDSKENTTKDEDKSSK